jgi:hypothetical protein
MKKLCLALLVVCSLLYSKPWAASQPLSSITGLVVPPNWETLAPYRTERLVADTDLPRFYDLRFYAGGYPKINRQKNNDCWAQGTVGVIEGLIKLNLFFEEKISVQQVISCSNRGTARSGGYFALSYHKSVGAVKEAEYPYTATDTRCKTGLRPSYALKDWGYVGQQGRAAAGTRVHCFG